MQLTKFSKPKVIHTPGKNLTVAGTLSRTFTKKPTTSNTSVATKTISTPNQFLYHERKPTQTRTLIGKT